MDSLKKLEAAAQRGNTDAQYRLAAMLASGNTVIKRNIESAVHWYEKAAKKNIQMRSTISDSCTCWAKA